MFKLYAMASMPTLIDKASNEYDICDTIGDYIKDNPEERFLIVKRENNTDEVYRAIRSMDEYVDYYQELMNRRLKEKSCVELKREMMDIVYDTPKPKVKRR